MLKYIILGAIGALVALAVYVRVAPINGETWNTVGLPVGAAGASTGAKSHTVLRDVADGAAALAARDRIISTTPRTKTVAGSVADGRITYVTRSRLFGFPDYTTIAITPTDGGGASLAVFGRARFGQSDLGVNKARITGWLAQLDEANL